MQISQDTSKVQHLSEDFINQIRNQLNYRVLINIIDVEVQASKTLKNPMFNVGHHYAILVYLSGDHRKLYYSGRFKILSLVDIGCDFLSYVVVHLTEDGLMGGYFSGPNELQTYYKTLHGNAIDEDVHKFKIHKFRTYVGSGAENSDNIILNFALNEVLGKKYNQTGTFLSLYQDRWNSRDLVTYLKQKLGR